MNKWLRLLTQIHIHPLLWLIVAIAVITARFQELLLLIVIVLIHELGHAAAASFFSWRIKNIILLPFGGVLETDEHGNRPIKEEFIVTVCGPAQHVWMMISAFLFHECQIIGDRIYSDFINYNFMILIFNCLPIMPLDGGKIVYLLFTKYYPFHIALKRSIILSLLFLFIYCSVILIVFPFHLNGWVIAIFLFLSLHNEWKNRPYTWMRFLIERYHRPTDEVGRIKKIYAKKDDLLSSAIEKFQRGTGHQIIVIDAGKQVAIIPEKKILKYYFEKSPIRLKLEDLLY